MGGSLIMNKKFGTLLIGGIICIALVVSYQLMQENTIKIENKNKQIVSVTEDTGKKYKNLGIVYKLPDKWKKMGNNIDVLGSGEEENILGQLMFSFITGENMDKIEKLGKKTNKISENDTEAMEKIQGELINLLQENKDLCTLVTIDKSKGEGQSQRELFAKFTNKELLGTEENFEMYLLYNATFDDSGLSEKSRQDLREAYGEIKKFKSLIKTYKPISEKEKISKYKKFDFKTETLDGKEIDSTIFKDSNITMVNIWATYCGPCIVEMPELQKLYEEVKGEKINIIGVITDTPDEDNEELAKQILGKKGVKFTNIIPDENIKNNILKDISGVPTTLFVDNKGNIIGEVILGSRSSEEYKQEIKDRLTSMQ